jgi:phage FluMu gp28-like protein
VDFGKYRDYSAVAVVESRDDELYLIHAYRFPLGGSYASVVGYVKTLCERWDSIVSVAADQTGVGEYIVEDMLNAGIPVEGVVLTQQRKEEILGYMKQLMIEGRLFVPYDPDLISEVNVEKYSLARDGRITFFHDEGAHDDRLWALALAVYASRGRIVSVSKGRRILRAVRRLACLVSGG